MVGHLECDSSGSIACSRTGLEYALITLKAKLFKDLLCYLFVTLESFFCPVQILYLLKYLHVSPLFIFIKKMLMWLATYDY